MLEVRHVDVFYDKVQALFDVSIEASENEIVSIIGSNGAGKSTLMKTICGLNRPSKGSVVYKGEVISTVKPHLIVRRGIVYVPEGREIFPRMSVRENLEMGAYSSRYSREKLHSMIQEQYHLFPRLEERKSQLAGTLSGGEQQMLAIARGLMSSTQLIMLDEPSLGLAPVLVNEMFDAILQINQQKGIPVILVEQNAYMALSISKRAYVLEVGHVVASGLSDDLMDSPEIKKAYLGG